MKHRRAIVSIAAACLVLLLLSGWALLQWRYPYGRSHCCIKSMFLALELYAQEHGGRFPVGQSSPEASLSLLYSEGLLDADILRGKTVREQLVRETFADGSLLGPETCGWQYVEGLSQADDTRIAILWSKGELGHYGEHFLHPAREVLLLGGGTKWITRPQWASFQLEQEQLLKSRKSVATNEVSSREDRVAAGKTSGKRTMAPLSATRSARTQEPASPHVLPGVKFHRQERPLSCEPAALKMALDAQGAHVAEAEIIFRMPFDKTKRTDSVWGDPDKGFVGNIDGEMLVDGYGVHSAPLAETASNWRKAEAIEGGSSAELAGHLLAGRPVIVWGFSGKSGSSIWQTPDGKTVHAVNGEHTRVVCGFRGSPSDPDGFFLMDPNCGLVYWPRRLFLSNWGALNRSGVAIYR